MPRLVNKEWLKKNKAFYVEKKQSAFKYVWGNQANVKMDLFQVTAESRCGS